jgi:pilus assembly protein Flp/PilA
MTPEGANMNAMLLNLSSNLRNLMNREEGQGMVEYGLIVALISLGLVALLTGVEQSLGTIFSQISSTLASAA